MSTPTIPTEVPSAPGSTWQNIQDGLGKALTLAMQYKVMQAAAKKSKPPKQPGIAPLVATPVAPPPAGKLSPMLLLGVGVAAVVLVLIVRK